MALELIALREQEIGVQLTLIEEIEAHLHPQAQLRVIKSFEKYLEDNPSLNAQYILTTHSPTLASSIKLENLIIIYEGEAYPMREEYTKLGEDDYTFLDRFLDATKANLFFAKGVILEGICREYFSAKYSRSDRPTITSIRSICSEYTRNPV